MSTADLVEMDAQIAKDLATPGTMESITWLQAGTVDKPHKLAGCMTQEESLAYVQKLKDMGAVSVMSVPHSAEHVSAPIRTILVIELPEDPEAQQKLYDWNVETSLEYLGDARDDIGTTHMVHMAGCRLEDSDFDDDDDEYDEE